MLHPSDYNDIGIVAKHCDLKKLNIAEKQAMDFDLSQLYCDEWFDLLEIWKGIIAYDAAPTVLPMPLNYAVNKKLIYGGDYLNCKDKTRYNEGIKTVLAYYSYSRYIILNGFNDTPVGVVTQTNEFSLPKPLKELENFADKYRNMGKLVFERTIAFMCANNTVYQWHDCKTCGCEGHDCSNTTNTKGYGFNGSIISKNI